MRQAEANLNRILHTRYIMVQLYQYQSGKYFPLELLPCKKFFASDPYQL